MDYRQKLRLLGFVETIPLWVVKRWVLKRKADVIYHAFDADLANAKARNDTEEYRVLRGQQKYEIEECIDELHSIESYRLEMEAQSLYIHVPGLKWEDGRFGHRYLDRESLSKLYYAVKEQKTRRATTA